jgi:hypothetical protein
MRFFSFWSLVGSNLRFYLSGKKIHLNNIRLVAPSSAVSSFMSEASHQNLKTGHIDNITTLILYEGLLVSQHLKSDYSSSLYSEMEDKLKIPSSTLTFRVMDHIASAYMKTFSSLTSVFISSSPQIRYVLKCLGKDKTVFLEKSLPDCVAQLPLVFQGKRTLVLSSYADLIKVQFVRLKAEDNSNPMYNYSLMAINPDKIVANTDRSLYFESLDAISMDVLNYTFDFLVVHEDLFSLPLLSFVSKLEIPCFILDDSIYSLYGIVKSRKEISGKKPEGIIFLEDFDKESNEDFTATSYLAKVPLHTKKDE